MTTFKQQVKNIYRVNDEEICGFFAEYRFLSNFYEAPVVFEGIEYSSSEVAYQAQKLDESARAEFSKFNAKDSKKKWKEYPLKYDPKEWDKIKGSIMAQIVEAKFDQNPQLKQKLLNTGTKYLEETNFWGDVFYGVCEGKGHNVLGNILMNLRTKFKENKC